MAASTEEDDTSWIQELATALLEECDLNTLRQVSQMKPVPDSLRSEVWKISLGVRGRSEVSDWDEIYDLAEQAAIRQDCQTLVERFGNADDEKLSVLCDLESVITRFCKQTGWRYQRKNGWLEVLEPLVALHLSKSELYFCFFTFMTNYVPKNCHKEAPAYHLLRLLLLYHDPELCSFLDTKKITPDMYCQNWFRSVFSATCNLNVVQAMWDIYLQWADPFLLFYLSLVLLANSKEQVMSSQDMSKEELIEILSTAPCALELADIEDFCSLAQYYAKQTPLSLKQDYRSLIFGLKPPLYKDIAQALCLPVSASELLESPVRTDISKSNVRYFVVDCRPAEQYNAGHLKTAFHLDASLMLQEPQAFSIAVQALLAAQKQAIEVGSIAAGEHLCFVGSGRDEEDRYVHMVIASFLQKHTQYVGQARGGYAELHRLVGGRLEEHLADHNSRCCISCAEEWNQAQKQNGGVSNGGGSSSGTNSTNGTLTDDEEVSFLDKMTFAVRAKAQDVKKKVIETIRTNASLIQASGGHVSSEDVASRRYRGSAPVFSCPDEDLDDAGIAEFETGEEVSISTWTQKPGVLGHFHCDLVKPKVVLPCRLVVFEQHMYVLREIPTKPDSAYIIARRPLVTIIKITSKRHIPSVITFKYGVCNDGVFTITSVDVFQIDRAAEATKLIKNQVEQLLELAELQRLSS